MLDFFADWFGAKRYHFNQKDHKEARAKRAKPPPPATGLRKFVGGRVQKKWHEKWQEKNKVVKPGKVKATSRIRVADQIRGDPGAGGIPVIRGDSQQLKAPSWLRGRGWGGDPVPREVREKKGLSTKNVPKRQQLFFEEDSGSSQSSGDEAMLGRKKKKPKKDPRCKPCRRVLGCLGDLKDDVEEALGIDDDDDDDDWEGPIAEDPSYRPIFVYIEILLLVLPYIVMSVLTGKSEAGLISIAPDLAELLVSKDCEDNRWQVWRWILYSFSHSSPTHLIVNVVVIGFCGWGLENFHGTWATIVLFYLGVLGGAFGYFLLDSHSFVIGASGGSYSLVGMQLGGIVLNPEQKKISQRILFLLLFFVIEFVNIYTGASGSQTSIATHTGGFFFGIVGMFFIGSTLGTNKSQNSFPCEPLVNKLCCVLLVVTIVLTLVWLARPGAPMNILEKEPYCAGRLVINTTLFGDGPDFCVGVDSKELMQRWDPWTQSNSVTKQSCDETFGGFKVTGQGPEALMTQSNWHGPSSGR